MITIENFEDQAVAEDTAGVSEDNIETNQTESVDEEQSGSPKEDEGFYFSKVENRYLTPEEMKEKHGSLEGKFTKTSQKLSEAEKRVEELERQVRESRSSSTAHTVTQATEVPDDVKQILDRYAEAHLIPRVKREIESEFSSEKTRSEFNTKVEQLSHKWDGKEGKPKFDADEDKDWLFSELTRPTQTIFDPELLWERAHEDDILNWRIESAIKQK